MPEPTAAQRQQAEDLRLMLHSSAWQHALALLFEQLRQHEAHLSPMYSEAVRCDAIGRRGMLLDLLTLLYRGAELPSPLETYYVQWLAHVQPPVSPPGTVPFESVVQPKPTATDPRRVRRQAGSVA